MKLGIKRWVAVYGVNALIGLAALLLVGCGSGLQGQKIDRGQFEVFLEKWNAYSLARGRHAGIIETQVEIAFGDTEDPDHYGLCKLNPFGSPVIIVDKEKWEGLSDASRESLMLHELGHCVLGREHETTQLEDRPVSLMNPNFISGRTYLAHQNEYLDELFQ